MNFDSILEQLPSPNAQYENNEEYKAFQKRKQTLLKNVDKLLVIKFPNDETKRQSYKDEVVKAMDEEESVIKTDIK